MNAIINYLRLPVLASSAFAALGSGLLYYKQKWVHLIVIPTKADRRQRAHLSKKPAHRCADG